MDNLHIAIVGNKATGKTSYQDVLGGKGYNQEYVPSHGVDIRKYLIQVAQDMTYHLTFYEIHSLPTLQEYLPRLDAVWIFVSAVGQPQDIDAYVQCINMITPHMTVLRVVSKTDIAYGNAFDASFIRISALNNLVYPPLCALLSSYQETPITDILSVTEDIEETFDNNALIDKFRFKLLECGIQPIVCISLFLMLGTCCCFKTVVI